MSKKKKKSIKEAFVNAEKSKDELGKEIDEIRQLAKEEGLEIEFEPDFAQQTPKKEGLPRVSLTRPSTVGDGIKAEIIARRTYDLGPGEAIPDFALMLAKLSMLARFDGKQLSIIEVEKLDPDFLYKVSTIYSPHLAH